MSVETAIENAQEKVEACYTAISNKGGTLPATQNLANMPTSIGSIPSGGTVINNQNKTVTQNGAYTADAGYTGLGTVTVNVDTVNNTSLSITPSTSSQSFTATAPYTGYSPVSVSAVTSSIDSNIQAGNIKDGVSILGVTGTYTGGGGSTKYGIGIDNVVGDINASGVLQMPVNTSGNIVFTGVKDLANNALAYKFNLNTNLACSVSFPDLEAISGAQGLYYSFFSTHITSVSLPKLKTVSGNNGLYNAFASTNITSLSLPELETISGSAALRNVVSNCANLTSISLPKLKTISNNYGVGYLVQSSKITTISLPELTTVSGNNALNSMCSSCQLLETAYFPKLSSINGSAVFNSAFSGCKVITDIYFNALTTTSFGSSYINQFNGMFNNNASSGTAATSGNVNVHFPRNLSSTIQGLTGYPLFGGATGKVTLLFDLTATS